MSGGSHLRIRCRLLGNTPTPKTNACLAGKIVNEMKNVLVFAFGEEFLLACHVFAQSSAPSEVNRITGARLSVEYNQDKTSATTHVTNVSDKIISTVRIALV